MPKFALILTLAAASVAISACGGSQKDERIEAAVSEAQRANAETDALKIRIENLENRLEHDEGMYADGYPVQPTPSLAPTSSKPAAAAARASTAATSTAKPARAEKAGRTHAGGHERGGGEERKKHH